MKRVKSIKRCAHANCKKRVPVVMRFLACSCGGSFCMKHRDKSQHACPTVEVTPAVKGGGHFEKIVKI